MTSLATQLKQLARPQTEAVQLQEDPHRKSLLFDPKEAARLDRDTFYDIGINGLYELINLDASFQEFEATLFDEASKSLERSVQSKEFNDSLDDKINQFLLRLIPYLPLKQAHKALEWLIHRFHVYHYNKEGLMRCILPYYETKIFVRILQLMDISDPTSHWHWLHPLQNAGVPLSRTVLLNQCSSNLSFLKFVGDILLKAIKVHSGTKENTSNLLRVAIAFYASTFVGTLENLRVVTENHVSALLPYLLKGLKSKMVDYKAATYMVVCQLVAKATLKEELLHPLINNLSKHIVPSLGLEGITCLAVISQTQDINSIPEKTFKNVCRLPDLVRILEQLSSVHNIEPLMALFLPPLICSTIEDTHETESDDDSEGIQYSALLENILQGVRLNISSAKLIASGLLNGYIEFCSDLSKEEAHTLKLRLAKIIHILETRYAVAMDIVMETFHSSEQQKKSKALAQVFLGLSLSGIKHQVLPVSDTSLVLSLNHPQPHAREIAVRQLLKNIKTGVDIDEFFVNAVIARMHDDDANVILAALWCEERSLCRFPTEQLFEALLAILKKWRGRTDTAWYKVGQRVLTLLTTSYLWSNNTNIVDRAMIALLPYLFPTTQNFAARSALTQIIVNAAMTSHHALLTNISSGISEGDFRQLLVDISEWYDRLGYINMLKVVYSDHVTDRHRLETATKMLDLLYSLIACGHLNEKNLTILCDTLKATKQFGFKSKIMNESFQNVRELVIPVSEFTWHRQKLIKLGMELNEDDVVRLDGIYNMPREKYEDSWCLIVDLEHRGKFVEGEIDTFIAVLRSHGMHPAVKVFQDEYATPDGDGSEAEKVYKITEFLVNLLGTNMASINKEDRLRITKLLYRCAQEEEGSIKPLRFLAIAIATSMIQHMTNAVERIEMCHDLIVFLEPEVIKISAIKGKKLTAILEEGQTAISSNWAADPLPSHFALNLGVRLVSKKKSRVVGSHNIDVGLADVVLWALSNVVKGIHLSDELPCTALRWSYSEYGEVRLYSNLLKKLFSVFMSGVSDSRASVFCKAFKDLSIQLFKLHLSNSSVLWEFFSTIWLDQSEDTSVRVLKIHSLNVAAATVKALSNEQVHKLLTSDSVVFPALLGVLCSPVEPVRKAGASLLQSLKEKLEKDCIAAYSLLLRHLNKRREEIVADANQLPQILSVFINKQSTTPSKQGSGSVSRQAALSALLHCLVGSLSSSVKHAVLIAIRSTDEKVVVTHSYALLDELLLELVESQFLSLTDSKNLSLILEHFTPATASLMTGPCQESFIKALGVDVPLAGGLGSPQELALRQLTKPFFLAIESVQIQEKLFSKVLDQVMLSTNPSTPSMFMKMLKKLPLSSKHLKNEFTILEGTAKSSIRETRKARRLAQKGATEQQSVDKGTHQRITYIMELIQQRKIKNVDDPELLTPCLFAVLQRCLNVATNEDHSSVEYLQQLVLTLLQNLCLHLSPDGETIPPDVLSEDQINVELVVQCVRVSDNPQTQNHALLLLGTLAKLFPERVLHNIMPIFTFMGEHLLRQDDNYSFQVIQRTVQTIIPTLVKADSETPEGALTAGTDNVVAMVLRVFVDALPHVPEHRQMMLFTELVATLGHKRYLWMLIVLLLTSHVEKSGGVDGKEEEEQKLSNDFKLPLSLCHQSPPSIQLRTLTKLVKYLLALPQDKPFEPQTPKRMKKTLKEAKAQGHDDTELFSIGNHSARQLRQFKFNTVTFIITVLASDEFVGQVVDMSEFEVEALNPLYQTLIDTTLQLITMSARSMEADAGKVTVKFWKAMIHKAYCIMDKVNSLLSMDLFVRVVLGLLSSPTPTIRRKALQLLNNKILQHLGSMDEKQVSLVLMVLDQLVSIAKSSPDASTDHDESFINQQTALYSLKLICKMAGTSHPQRFGPVIDVAIEIMTNSKSNLQVVSSACLLLGEVVRCMKAHTIPSIPRFMPSLLQHLETKETASSSDLHLVSVLMAVYRVMETLPHFLNPYLLQITQQVCRFSVNSEDSTSQLNLRLKAIAHQLAASLAPRVLLPVISQVYDTLLTTNQAGIASLMAILKEHIIMLNKENLKAQMGTLQGLFMNALDFRSCHSKDDLEKAKAVEDHILDALLSLVMRLSEVSFRPLFLKLYNWATRGSVQEERLLTFYQMTDMLAEKMKSIFTLFAGHMVKNCAELLNNCNSSKSNEPVFEGAKRNLLLQSVLSTLYKVFLYDKEGFVSKERFEVLTMPLLDQVENTSIGEDEYQALIDSHLTPCIAQMMTSAQDTGCWQPLNYQLLLKTRNSEPKVRYATLVILEEVHKQLGEEFLTLLPETLPFLSELLEDESTEVEIQCQKVIGQLENTLGEPLHKYF